MHERKIIFEVYDEIDKIAYTLNGIYQTLYSMDLETLTSFVDGQGKASKAFLCQSLMSIMKSYMTFYINLYSI